MSNGLNATVGKQPLLCQFIDSIEEAPRTESLDLKQFISVRSKVKLPRTNLYRSPVLMLTSKTDFHTDLIGIELLKRGIDYVRLNREDIACGQVRIIYSIQTDEGARIELAVNGEQVPDAQAISVVWLRDFDLTTLIFNARENTMATAFTFQQWYDAWRILQNNLCTADTIWLPGKPDVTINATYDRLKQLSTAKCLGFDIPSTIITNDPIAARDFYNKYNGEIILKALHHHAVELQAKYYFMFTHVVKTEDLSRFGDLQHAPCTLQQKITKKADLRVTVVGDQVFSVRMTQPKSSLSECDDIHRTSLRSLSPKVEKLDNKTHEQCVNLISKMGISYGAIDFVIDENGHMFFLEVNPVCDWYALERETGLLITKAIVDMIEKSIKVKN